MGSRGGSYINGGRGSSSTVTPSTSRSSSSVSVPSSSRSGGSSGGFSGASRGGSGGGFGYLSVLEGADISLLEAVSLAHWLCANAKERKKQYISF